MGSPGSWLIKLAVFKLSVKRVERNVMEMTTGVAIKALKRRNAGHTIYFHPKKSSTCSINLKKKSRDKKKTLLKVAQLQMLAEVENPLHPGRVDFEL